MDFFFCFFFCYAEEMLLDLAAIAFARRQIEKEREKPFVLFDS